MMDLLQMREENIFYRTGIDSKAKQSEYATNTSIEITDHTPQPAQVITNGICTNCDNLGHCVWQQNNNTNCQHYK